MENQPSLGGVVALLSDDLAHAKEHPSPPVAGCLNVMPLSEEGKLVLQFNGWAIELSEGGAWRYEKTTHTPRNENLRPIA